DGRWFCLPRLHDGSRGGLRDPEALGQRRQGTGRGIAEGPQGRQQHGEEHVDPLVGLALAHAEQAPLHHLEAVGLHISQNKQESILRGRQRAVLVHAKLAGRPRLPIEAPRRHMRVERRLEGREEQLKLVEGPTGEIQELHGTGLQIGELHMGHRWYLLSWEAQYTINRDNLKRTPERSRPEASPSPRVKPHRSWCPSRSLR